MSHINLVNTSGEALKWSDGSPIRYEQQPETDGGFEHATANNPLKCRKCKAVVKKLLRKAQLCKQCYRVKDALRKGN